MLTRGRDSYLNSEVFEVVAQFGEKQFLVHSGILAAQSKPLGSIITSVLADKSIDRKIDLKEWDGDTVGRFVEFLYVGHYDFPDPTPPLVGPESIVSDDGAAQQDLNTPETAQSVVSETAQSDKTETIQPESPVGPRPLTPLSQFDLQPKSDVGEYLRPWPFDPALYDFGEVLLAHAKVYFLAQDQEVDALRRLAYQHLLLALKDIGSVEPSWQVAVNIVDLLRYSYSHMVSSGSSEEPLQNLVSQFAALNFPALQGRNEMTLLIKEGGQLASDLMDKVCRRLVNSESGLREAAEAAEAAKGRQGCPQKEHMWREEVAKLSARVRSLDGLLNKSRDEFGRVETELKVWQREVSTLGVRIRSLEGLVKVGGDNLRRSEAECKAERQNASEWQTKVKTLERRNVSIFPLKPRAL